MTRLESHNEIEQNEKASPERELAALRQRAEEARAAYEWAEAQRLYSLALELPDLTAEVEYELLDGRAESHSYLGKSADEEADLEVMIQLATEQGDLARQGKALYRLAAGNYGLNPRIDKERQLEAALELLVLAEKIGDRRLVVDAHFANVVASYLSVDVARLKHHVEAMRHLAQEINYQEGFARALAASAWQLRYADGDREEALISLQRALAIFASKGNHLWEAQTLRMLGYFTSDLGNSRRWSQQALRIAKAIGHEGEQLILINNLSWNSHQLGLYGRALEDILTLWPAVNSEASVTPYLTLAENYLATGQYDSARLTIAEAMVLAGKLESEFDKIYVGFVRGLIEFHAGYPQEARSRLTEATKGFEILNYQTNRITSLSWLAAVDLALGDVAAALDHSEMALANPDIKGDYPQQEVWWWRYRALVAAESPGKGETAGQDPMGSTTPSPSQLPQPLFSDDSWTALDNACNLVMEGIASISDEGLRRNYLNKVVINRDIIVEWSRQAIRRGLSMTPVLQRAASTTSLQEQFKRLVNLGAHLTTRRDPAGLPQFHPRRVCGIKRCGALFYPLGDVGKRW